MSNNKISSLKSNLIMDSNIVILENTDKIHEEAHFAVADSMGRLILYGYVQIPGNGEEFL